MTSANARIMLMTFFRASKSRYPNQHGKVMDAVHGLV